MTQTEARKAIENIPVGSKLQLIKTNGDIIEVTLASNEVSSVDKKSYASLEVPELPPAIIVQGNRWGTYRIETEEITHIAHIAKD